ncbi:hypothetical protein KGQ24_00470 [Patescibacteria group bacterium]|nr:hypothetical protein [Patescibacteria group bacterium]
MSWITNLQSKPKKEKIKILWLGLVAALVILVILWIIIGNLKPDAQKDTSLFNEFGNSIKNFKLPKTNQ